LGVLERQVPDGEGLELGITRVHPVLVVVVELGEARGKLAAAWSGTRYDDQGLVGLDVLVGTVSLLAHDEVHVRGISLGVEVGVDPDASPLELVLEQVRRRLALEPGDDDPDHMNAPSFEIVDELHGIGVVRDTEIGPDLLALDITRKDTQDDVCLVSQPVQEPHLHVRVIAGQDPCGMVVVHELAPELEVKLVVEPLYPLEDTPRLFLQITLVVEADP